MSETDPFLGLDNDALASAYLDLVERVSMVVSADGVDLEATVPCCPNWTIKDTVAHLVGVTEDVLQGRLTGVASAAWTEAQVGRHVTDSIDALLDTWEPLAMQLTAAIKLIPEAPATQLVFDAMTHELDLRHALGVPLTFVPTALVAAYRFATGMVRTTVGTAGLVGVTVNIGSSELVIYGIDGAVFDVAIDAFTLLRTLTGRRSVAQRAASGLPEPWWVSIQTSTPFAPSLFDIEEIAPPTMGS